jgi:hypothetical protein
MTDESKTTLREEVAYLLYFIGALGFWAGLGWLVAT